MVPHIPKAPSNEQHLALHGCAGRRCTRPEGAGKVENMPGCYITTARAAADAVPPIAAPRSFPPQVSSYYLPTKPAGRDSICLYSPIKYALFSHLSDISLLSLKARDDIMKLESMYISKYEYTVFTTLFLSLSVTVCSSFASTE